MYSYHAVIHSIQICSHPFENASREISSRSCLPLIRIFDTESPALETMSHQLSATAYGRSTGRTESSKEIRMIRPHWQIVERTKPSNVQEVLEILLRNRKATSSFLNGTLKDLEPYLTVCGMNRGAQLMGRHLSAGNKIVLIGDYDCDGITSLAQMALFLNDIGYRNYEVAIPKRSEGYGIPKGIAKAHPDARLFVAMDCGTLDAKPVTDIRSMGADCIVIDHHEVPEKGLAPASVLINPKQPTCHSTFKEFCSSGLTLLFLTRLRRAISHPFRSPSLGGKYLALAAIGTVADMVPLVEGNRILARSGLSSINAKSYLPIQKIADTAGLASKKSLSAGHVGYYLGPRINAAGRMADARIAFDLLVSQHPGEILRLAQELNHLNAQRQNAEDLILRSIRERLAKISTPRRTMVMADAGWAPGVIGIVASRIQQEFHYGPTIVFSVDEKEGIARGSARSIPGFDIHAALKDCDEFLIKWGGHKMAAGMTVSMEQMERFARRFEAVAQEHSPDIFVPKARVDLELNLDLVSRELLDALALLEPHGLGNPTPTFAARRVRLSVKKVFGREQNHLRLLLNNCIEGTFWRGAQEYAQGNWREDTPLDLVFQAEWDDYSNKPVLNVKAVGHFLPD